MNWLLIGILIFMLICTINGYRKGFIRLAVSFVFVIITIALVRMVTPYLGSFLEQHTPVYSTIKENCMEIFREDAGDYDQEKKTDQVKAIESSRLPEKFKKSLMENNNAEIYSILEVTGFDEYIGTYVAKTLTNIIAFVLAFIIIYLALKLILFSLDLIARLPVLHGINKTAGLLLGLAESLVFIWVFFLAITIFFTGKTGENLMGMVNDSLFLRFLYSNNYLLKIISASVLGV